MVFSCFCNIKCYCNFKKVYTYTVILFAYLILYAIVYGIFDDKLTVIENPEIS